MIIDRLCVCVCIPLQAATFQCEIPQNTHDTYDDEMREDDLAGVRLFI